ncbi:hypothetical protein UFOVP943_20 [uncultured Caudovirales phage]|uniref:Uncharacterized protein n=1 Tax=uncultured Caudovirales phage TaxID=2100421 RepID=A0A6J5PWL5_9CAUD|nr:hypothetical protein UFOVP943_20 [uncultured Caudovirales phage]CAB4183901.1 hypothetical protein UFOVP1111_15 [uncultured Caudovirales phage]CAB4203294.1 hypothetical protein UFOVP1380_20 [uncultured Caudovirales phage]
MNRYPTLTIRLSQETLRWLKAEATLFDTSIADIVKRSLDHYQETKYPPAD